MKFQSRGSGIWVGSQSCSYTGALPTFQLEIQKEVLNIWNLGHCQVSAHPALCLHMPFFPVRSLIVKCKYMLQSDRRECIIGMKPSLNVDRKYLTHNTQVAHSCNIARHPCRDETSAQCLGTSAVTGGEDQENDRFGEKRLAGKVSNRIDVRV